MIRTFVLTRGARSIPRTRSQETQSPFHQNGEQGLHFKDLCALPHGLKIGPFNQIYKKGVKNKRLVCDGSQTPMSERTVLTILLAYWLQIHKKRLIRIRNADPSSLPPVVYTAGVCSSKTERRRSQPRNPLMTETAFRTIEMDWILSHALPRCLSLTHLI